MDAVYIFGIQKPQKIFQYLAPQATFPRHPHVSTFPCTPLCSHLSLETTFRSLGSQNKEQRDVVRLRGCFFPRGTISTASEDLAPAPEQQNLLVFHFTNEIRQISTVLTFLECLYLIPGMKTCHDKYLLKAGDLAFLLCSLESTVPMGDSPEEALVPLFVLSLSVCWQISWLGSIPADSIPLLLPELGQHSPPLSLPKATTSTSCLHAHCISAEFSEDVHSCSDGIPNSSTSFQYLSFSPSHCVDSTFLSSATHLSHQRIHRACPSSLNTHCGSCKSQWLSFLAAGSEHEAPPQPVAWNTRQPVCL